MGRSTLGRSAMGRSILQKYIGEEHRSTLVKSTTLWRSTVASVEWNGRINNRWLYKNPTDPTDCQGNLFYRVNLPRAAFDKIHALLHISTYDMFLRLGTFVNSSSMTCIKAQGNPIASNLRIFVNTFFPIFSYASSSTLYPCQ